MIRNKKKFSVTTLLKLDNQTSKHSGTFIIQYRFF